VKTTNPFVAFEKAKDSRERVDFVGCAVVAAAEGAGCEAKVIADEKRSNATEMTLTIGRITRRLVAPLTLGITAEISGQVGAVPGH
jgi:hypothetical protein